MGGSSHEAHSVVPFRNFEEEMKRPGVWETENGSASTVDSTRDNLASLYRPPFALMYQGSFEKVNGYAGAVFGLNKCFWSSFTLLLLLIFFGFYFLF